MAGAPGRLTQTAQKVRKRQPAPQARQKVARGKAPRSPWYKKPLDSKPRKGDTLDVHEDLLGQRFLALLKGAVRVLYGPGDPLRSAPGYLLPRLRRYDVSVPGSGALRHWLQRR
jgi:hypothetical protein